MDRRAERLVIVGAGQAGAQVAISLRQLGFAGDDQPARRRAGAALPAAAALQGLYERRDGARADPDPLRGVLRQERDRSAARRPGRRGSCATGARRSWSAARCPTTCWCCAPAPGPGASGCRARIWRGVFYLRTLADSERIRAAARPGARAVIIGGGYIGLEVAASLTKLGADGDRAGGLDRVMNRVVAPPVSPSSPPSMRSTASRSRPGPRSQPSRASRRSSGWCAGTGACSPPIWS